MGEPNLHLQTWGPTGSPKALSPEPEALHRPYTLNTEPKTLRPDL